MAVTSSSNTTTKTINISTEQSQRSIKSLRQEIKELKDEILNLDESSQEYADTLLVLGDKQHELTELNERARNVNNDFGDTLKRATGTITGAIGAVQGMTAGLSLLGVQMGDDDKLLKNLIKSATLLQGAMQFEQGIKDLKNLATQIKANIGAAGGLTNIFRSMTAASPWGAVAAGAVAAAGGVALLIGRLRDARTESDELKKSAEEIERAYSTVFYSINEILAKNQYMTSELPQEIERLKKSLGEFTKEAGLTNATYTQWVNNLSEADKQYGEILDVVRDLLILDQQREEMRKSSISNEEYIKRTTQFAEQQSELEKKRNQLAVAYLETQKKTNATVGGRKPLRDDEEEYDKKREESLKRQLEYELKLQESYMNRTIIQQRNADGTLMYDKPTVKNKQGKDVTLKIPVEVYLPDNQEAKLRERERKAIEEIRRILFDTPEDTTSPVLKDISDVLSEVADKMTIYEKKVRDLIVARDLFRDKTEAQAKQLMDEISALREENKTLDQNSLKYKENEVAIAQKINQERELTQKSKETVTSYNNQIEAHKAIIQSHKDEIKESSRLIKSNTDLIVAREKNIAMYKSMSNGLMGLLNYYKLANDGTVQYTNNIEQNTRALNENENAIQNQMREVENMKTVINQFNETTWTNPDKNLSAELSKYTTLSWSELNAAYSKGEETLTQLLLDNARLREQIQEDSMARRLQSVQRYYDAYTTTVSYSVGLLNAITANLDENDPEHLEKIKGIKKAIIAMETLQGMTEAFMRGFSLGGFALGGTYAALVAATGWANWRAVDKTTSRNSNTIGGASASSAATRTVSSPPEIVNLNAMNDNITLPDQRVYVTEHDITAAQRRVRVVESNNTI